MVDRAKRLLAAQVLREFIEGGITNFDFEEQFPQSGPDKALVAIANMVWFAYDDFRTHRLVEEDALSDAGREALVRCLLFLSTDLEYAGPTRFVAPDIPMDNPPPGRFERLLNRMAGKQTIPIQFAEWNAATWPFNDHQQLQQAMSAAGGTGFRASDPLCRRCSG